MFKKKEATKTVIQIDDQSLSYITLHHDEEGFFVSQYQSIDLPEGTVVRGEILKADILYTLVKKVAKEIQNNTVDILLDHDYFLCSEGDLSSKSNEPLKKRVSKYFKEVAKSEPWHTDHVCEFSQHEIQGKEKVLFTCLPKDIYKSYVHVFEKAELKIQSLSSDILAFDHLLLDSRASLIIVAKNNIRIAEFKEGIYVSHKTFQVSYQQFLQDIIKTLQVSETEAQKILRNYGVLRAHKEERVYKKLQRSFSPLLEFISARKIKETASTYVMFFDLPILGLIDTIKKTLNTKVTELDVLHTNKFIFQDILTLHRDESYQYQALIAQALKHWKKD